MLMGKLLKDGTFRHHFVKSVKFGDLAYEDDALRTVELGIRYDWATCEFTADHPDFKDTYFEKAVNQQVMVRLTTIPTPAVNGV
jgi:hypothetical protein